MSIIVIIYVRRSTLIVLDRKQPQECQQLFFIHLVIDIVLRKKNFFIIAWLVTVPFVKRASRRFPRCEWLAGASLKRVHQSWGRSTRVAATSFNVSFRGGDVPGGISGVLGSNLVGARSVPRDQGESWAVGSVEFSPPRGKLSDPQTIKRLTYARVLSQRDTEGKIVGARRRGNWRSETKMPSVYNETTNILTTYLILILLLISLWLLYAGLF